MFESFESVKKSLYMERVNTLLGTAFIATVALWAAMFIWNVTSGSNPLDDAIASAIVRSELNTQY